MLLRREGVVERISENRRPRYDMIEEMMMSRRHESVVSLGTKDYWIQNIVVILQK